MNKILLIIILVLILANIGVSIYNNLYGFKFEFFDNFEKQDQQYLIFPGQTLEDLPKPNIDYSYDWVTQIPITVDNDNKSNPDAKYMVKFAQLNELKTKLYEK